MHDSTFLIIGIFAETGVVAVLGNRRVYRTLPVFVTYMCWNLVSDVVVSRIGPLLLPNEYLHVYEMVTIIDTAFTIVVWVELTKRLLKRSVTYSTGSTWVGIAVVFMLIAGTLWPLTGAALGPYDGREAAGLFRLQQFAAILKVVPFMTLATFSHALSLTWHKREFQVATGLGFYAIVSLAITILRTHQTFAIHYLPLQGILALAWVGIFAYWGVVFATDEDGVTYSAIGRDPSAQK